MPPAEAAGGQGRAGTQCDLQPRGRTDELGHCTASPAPASRDAQAACAECSFLTWRQQNTVKPRVLIGSTGRKGPRWLPAGGGVTTMADSSGPPCVTSPGPRGGCPQSRSTKSACWGLVVPRLPKRLFLKQAKNWPPVAISGTSPAAPRTLCRSLKRSRGRRLDPDQCSSWRRARRKLPGEFFGNVIRLCLSNPRTPVLCRAPSDIARQGGSQQQDPEAQDIAIVLLREPTLCQDGAKMTSNLENYIIIRVLKTGKKKSEVIARDPEAAVPRSSPPGIKSRAQDPEVTGAEGAVPACRPEVCTSRRLGSIYGERLFL